MTRHALVIFDCDGVLVDSEPTSSRILAEQLTALGLPTTQEESIDRYMGGSAASIIADIERRLGRRTPENFLKDFNAACFAAFDAELEPVDGIAALLDSLAESGTLTCVASSGDHEKLRRTLGHTGLLERFEGRIFSSTEVPNGKPAPDLFLHAASRMGVSPGRCAVVEDSPVGVTAAVAASMTVFGYAGRTPVERLAREGVRTFGAMRELPALLG